MTIYFSVDVETDGKIPGKNSMLSLGCAAFLEDKTLLGTFSINLLELEGASGDSDTLAWWKTQPEAWKALQENRVHPEDAMHEFVSWVRSVQQMIATKTDCVMVAFPAGFDFTFIYWYLSKFNMRHPFSFSCIDIKTYAMAVLKCDYKEATKRNFPSHWFSKRPHTHVAVDDAIEQGELFLNILSEHRKSL